MPRVCSLVLLVGFICAPAAVAQDAPRESDYTAFPTADGAESPWDQRVDSAGDASYVQRAAATQPVARAERTPAPLENRPAAKALPLKGPSEGGSRQRLAGGSVGKLLGSVGVVLGLFFLVAWVLKRSMPSGSMLLPREAVEVLGRAPLATRQFVHLIRCGNKLLLVSISPTGAETLTEITDAREVDRLLALCQQPRSASGGTSFRQVFENLGRQPRTAPLRMVQGDPDFSTLAGIGPRSPAGDK